MSLEWTLTPAVTRLLMIMIISECFVQQQKQTKTARTAIVRISVFECHECPLHMPPGRRCCSTDSDIYCLSVEALQTTRFV